MLGGRMNAWRAVVMLFGLVAGPISAVAVPVTWEAQGSVVSSDLESVFFATFIPELAGAQPVDDLVLRITFDTDAPLVEEKTHDTGGATFSFDALSLVLELEVPRLGTHVFSIDGPIPGAAVRPQLFVLDDLVSQSLIFDSLQFGHQYLTEAGDLKFSAISVFSSTDTSILDGGRLPLSPDPRLRAGFEHEVSIFDSNRGTS